MPARPGPGRQHGGVTDWHDVPSWLRRAHSQAARAVPPWGLPNAKPQQYTPTHNSNALKPPALTRRTNSFCSGLTRAKTCTKGMSLRATPAASACDSASPARWRGRRRAQCQGLRPKTQAQSLNRQHQPLQGPRPPASSPAPAAAQRSHQSGRGRAATPAAAAPASCVQTAFEPTRQGRTTRTRRPHLASPGGRLVPLVRRRSIRRTQPWRVRCDGGHT